MSFVRRCDEIERKLRFFTAECEKFDLELEAAGTIDSFLDQLSQPGNKESGAQLLEAMEAELEGYESQLKELNSYSEKLTTEYNEKVELQEVLEIGRAHV